MKKIYMEEGFIVMNLSKHKRWRAHSDCKTIKTYPVCLYAAEKYEKVESLNTQNDYETASKK